MKTLYIECKMGVAGDMLTAALLELVPDKKAFLDKLNAIGIPGVTYEAEPSVKCGITGTHISVKVDGVEEDENMHDHHHDHDHGDHHHDHDHGDHNHDHDHDDHHHDHDHGHSHSHSDMASIRHIVNDHLNVSDKVKKDVLSIYELIAEAESSVHDRPVDQIHFHEVGSMDAVADITAVCMLMEEISPDRIVVSPIHVGSGNVKCAHGILPVPAPATAHILKGIPAYGGSINGELCTPTGAALVKHFASEFSDMPVMNVSNIGYGMGRKDFEMANCVRAMIGESAERQMGGGSKAGNNEVLELSCNVDDMTAEEIGYATGKLFEGGALEVYTVPVGMKKNRPGTLIRVMCTEAEKDDMISLIFRHTTTIGIRETVTKRYVLDRRTETVNTPYGEVRCKISEGYGVKRTKYEYDDLARIADENGISLEEARAFATRG